MVEAVTDRILVRREGEKEKIGNILLTVHGRQKPPVGVVVSAGPGALNSKNVLVPMTVSVGDRIAYTPGAGLEVDVNGENLVVIRQGDVLMTLDEDTAWG